MRWGAVREGDVLIWHDDELDEAPVYLVLRATWNAIGEGETLEYHLAEGELYESRRRASLGLELVKAILRGGDVVWGSLE